ncbi:hypothetical protein ACFRAR_24270 [Kitasatospora sp. NPDC056651]|uniref:hypothetical protein n=1 Tax=Kitasatospora sp. NPDC056651 TaxID=3345892 RepID=UPI00368E826E
METEYSRQLKDVEGWSLAAKLVGGLTVAVWLFALWQVFVPGNGTCDAPAFYQPKSFHLQEVCDSEAIGRIGGAVAAVLVALPLAALWGWAFVRLRASRAALDAMSNR